MQSRRPSFQRWISALLLPCYLAACTSWHRDTQPLPETLAAESQPTLRLTLTNGQRITLTDLRIVGDSVVGMGKPTLERLRDPTVLDKRPRVAVALADIQIMERPAVSQLNTGWLIMGAGLLAAAIVFGLIPEVEKGCCGGFR